jgi:Lar family restriction alleviation protein
MPFINGKYIDGHEFIKPLEEIKNCPFCGELAVIEQEDKGWGYFIISCINCDANIRGETEDDVIRKWNKRI